MINGMSQTHAIGRDVATALGYAVPQKAVQEHVDEEDKKTSILRAFSISEKASGQKMNDRRIARAG